MDATSAHLQDALDAQVTVGAPSAFGRIEAPGAGLTLAGSAGQLARGEGRPVQPDDAFRIASVSKSVTAAATVRLAGEERIDLDGPLGDQLSSDLLDRWRVFEDLPRTTP
ncbi:MAG: serine hydrolase, partial [Solirubrobacterales bacterium]